MDIYTKKCYDINIIYCDGKEETMSVMRLEKVQDRTENKKYMANGLLAKLNEAIDDMELGKVQSIEEAWEEIDAV